jgi:hypothetical protein
MLALLGGHRWTETAVLRTGLGVDVQACVPLRSLLMSLGGLGVLVKNSNVGGGEEKKACWRVVGVLPDSKGNNISWVGRAEGTVVRSGKWWADFRGENVSMSMSMR